MEIYIGSNVFGKLICKFNNKVLEFNHKRWNNGVHRCKCHVCGDVLDSREDPYTPDECGWRRLKGKIYDPWICHTCLEHHEFAWKKKDYAEMPALHGKWVLLDECSNEGVYCSVCNKKVYRKDYANQKVKSKYCPNCGAIMDLE